VLAIAIEPNPRSAPRRAHLSRLAASPAAIPNHSTLLWWCFAPKLAAERRGPGGRSLDSSSTANHDHA
jgi:hypothetical protein